jgi:murein DD-endopeptidase MepM/ murein hydrolase activator NlpD
MSFFKYNFNSRTRMRGVSHLKSIVLYGSRVLFTAIVLLGMMIAVHDYLIKSPKSSLIKEENEKLATYKPGLEVRVNEVEQKLAQLKTVDSSLYGRLFNSTPSDPDTNTHKLTRDKVLLAGIADFHSILDMLRERSAQLVEKSAATNQSFGERIRISKEQIQALQNLPTIQPVFNAELDQLVSGFGVRINPFHKGKYNHPGVDFAAPRGSAVFATAPGRVVTVKKTSLQAGYGNFVEIDHGNGFVTRYAHLDGISVRRGQKVFKGKVIGTAGSSGGSVAPHLHYEVIRDGEQVDPVNYLLEGLTSEQYGSLLQNASKQNQSLD